MEIKRLKISKLYGYIDKDITFNSDITLLVGINGSGKTSILNVVNWIISPSIPDLCITEFKSLKLWLSFENKDYEIACKHGKSKFYYKVKTQDTRYNELIVNHKRHPRDIQNNKTIRANLINSYKNLMPVEEEKETWDLIRSFPTPTIVGLDRNLYAEESADIAYYDEGFKSRNRTKKINSLNSPINRVKEIINVEYRKRKNRVLNLTNSLKNQLIISAFDGNITLDSLTSGTRYNLNLSQIEKAENRINDYFENFEKNSLTLKESETIANYFAQLKNITSQYQIEPNDDRVKLLYGLNTHQFIKIKNLLKKFDKFENESTKAMEEIQTYINTLNHFLKDSAKEILFKEDTSEITFNNLDKNGVPITKYKDINFLSSGEQQILILFSYIAFNSDDGKIFIIDEPELSLHIKWQEDFLEELEKITPKSTQLILATHSPILANKKKNKAITLLSYNV